MELEKIDLDLLKAIYEKDYKNKKINWFAIGFESNNHKAFHLKRLERFDLIELEKNALVPGGRIDLKYGTAIAIVWSEVIHIKEKGINALKLEQ
ncbi:hypothetical protein [Bacillus sp. 03113]|uniref:hypothetical protein n=1 Tax=Bacillus sp. 03113 TaxID=2578211 RepID=UPI00114277D5|nr:hypothetical protein [Bacillus sp. 03113]